MKTYTYINSKKAIIKFAKYSVGFLCCGIFYVADVSAACTSTALNLNSQGYTLQNNACLTNNGTNNTLSNSGTIFVGSGGNAITNQADGTIISNTGTITITDGDVINNAIGNTISSIRNSGTITAGQYQYGINNNDASSQITSILNTGTIQGGSGDPSSSGLYGGDAILNFGTITTITNAGTILRGGVSDTFGINNSGGSSSIVTLNNAQGIGNTNGALTYKGILPTNYNIIVNSTNYYGQVKVTAPSGSMAFNIYGNTGTTLVSGVSASTVSAYRYLNVLQGFSSLSNVTGTSGTYGIYSYSLVADASVANSWDLLITGGGPSAANTQTSLQNTSSALQNIFTLQSSVLANSFTYDCAVFGKNNVCVSAGGRYTAVQSNGPNNTSALLIGAYRLSPNYRIGAYADQNLSVNNAGTGVSLGNGAPLIGLFSVWNEKLDGAGTEVKVSAAYGQKSTTVTRAVVGTSEAGSGSSNLNSQGAQVIAKYGFGVLEGVMVSPYVGMRYTQNNMGGYTEATSSTVTAPLTYSSLNTNATTALAGIGASYRFIPQAMLFASAGIETDTNTSNGTYSATGVTGLTPINFNPNPVKTRPTAMLGAYYDVEKSQRLGITGIYRQDPYQSVSTTALMATYTIGM